MLTKIHNNKKPEILVITPLRPIDNISRDTKVSLKRNNVSFIWYSYKGEGNTMENFVRGLEEVEKEIKLPEYVIKIDADTIWNRNTLDKMYFTLKEAKTASYCYCSFRYTGAVNARFDAIPFDKEKLKRGNYISSNSLFRTKVLKEIPPVIDDYYARLLDWSYYLLLLNYGHIGINCPSGYFEAKASKDSISAKSIEDYKIKYRRVKKDFIGE